MMTLLLAALVMVLPASGDDAGSAERPECTITGTSGSDQDLRGTAEPNVICGFGGDDQVFARQGADSVFGGRGADTLVGRSGGDQMYGGRGDDFIIGRGGLDLLSGQAGRDCLAAEEQTNRTEETLSEAGQVQGTTTQPTLRT